VLPASARPGCPARSPIEPVWTDSPPDIIASRGCSTTRIQLQILDDWGLTRLGAQQRRDILEILEDRYHRRSTIITSQLPVKTWHDYIGEPTLADAILDRVVHSAHRIELRGPSMRKNSKSKDMKEES